MHSICNIQQFHMLQTNFKNIHLAQDEMQNFRPIWNDMLKNPSIPTTPNIVQGHNKKNTPA